MNDSPAVSRGLHWNPTSANGRLMLLINSLSGVRYLRFRLSLTLSISRASDRIARTSGTADRPPRWHDLCMNVVLFMHVPPNETSPVRVRKRSRYEDG